MSLKISVAEWLATRQPSAPENLRDRMNSEISKLGIAESEISAKALADAGSSILNSLDESGCTHRANALDLLAADALFTYAFEAASESKSEIEETARYVFEKVTQ